MRITPSGVWLLACALGASCASPLPPAPPPPVILPSPAGPPAAPASRPLPGFRTGADQPGYPPEALAARRTGRVLVEFRIEAGRATGISVARAQADPSLQQAAVAIIAATYFDLHDRNSNPADPRPFFVSVQFCLDYCGELRPFPGYEQNALIITAPSPPGSPLR